ncbi:MAG: hypothetical protein KF735_01575 [Chelatococcus sp.]|uniref:hypothetical protein n=1 Tax=unclassified Chelatococcus TaxID=2638111 RepID=UPI001BCAE80C|nr:MULTISPECIES: hypothetical protein [unclassified Chelatococcus]CAH1663709.1 conserved hypothetical protein [Hyphomicrobiales bacterium]MBS7741611.1 hypothetical protein [Chelatococcus sp. HY11]MBX3536300.1 hypothetical protein [Chelatococcus sp.]MBX3544370.1 hypothetical protein [Chelatococcus sp.]MCO5079106.1 hypothetical protein [Chelatococcus sp.]
MRFGLFGRKHKRGENPALLAIKAWVREIARLPEDTVIAANEIICADPSCPGTETVVLIMEPGQETRAIKIELAADEITRADVDAALAAGQGA